MPTSQNIVVSTCDTLFQYVNVLEYLPRETILNLQLNFDLCFWLFLLLVSSYQKPATSSQLLFHLVASFQQLTLPILFGIPAHMPPLVSNLCCSFGVPYSIILIAYSVMHITSYLCSYYKNNFQQLSIKGRTRFTFTSY